MAIAPSFYFLTCLYPYNEYGGRRVRADYLVEGGVSQMSFSIDMGPVMSYANMVLTWMWPILAIGLGFNLGFGLLGFIMRIFRGALSGF